MERSETIEILRHLTSRLAAPDLTLSEARQLRLRLAELLTQSHYRTRLDWCEALSSGSERKPNPERKRTNVPLRIAG